MIRGDACLHRTCQSIASIRNERTPVLNGLARAFVLRSSNGNVAVLPLSGRRYATSMAGLKNPQHRKELKKWTNAKNRNIIPPMNKSKDRRPSAALKLDARDAKARAKNRAWMMKETGDKAQSRPQRAALEKDESTSQAGEDPGTSKVLMKARADVERYYKDPLQLADAVLQRLKNADVDAALLLIKASDHFKMPNIVSWNHCLDWYLAQGNVKNAIGLYNDMKKRGHRPDAHTYTIMLRGLSQNVQRKSAVKDAVKIYNSIFAPNSAVKPSTIHTNAVINVCARGGDMESLWAVAGRLPERGPGSADRLTYTTILNAIRENTVKQVAPSLDKRTFRGNTEEAEQYRAMIYQRAVQDGKKLWTDIANRWRAADLVIDEQLVVAMGRLLISCGQEADIEQVLDLVESTMQIKVPNRSKKQHMALEQPLFEEKSPIDIGSKDAVPKPYKTDGENYKPVTTSMPLEQSNIYATPGNKTLNMILNACTSSTPIRHLVTSYWHAMVTESSGPQIKPDAGNVMAYLRILRLRRASTRVLDLLEQEWPDEIAHKIYTRGAFVLAVSTCVRDKNNQNVFETACKLVRLMETKLNAQKLKRNRRLRELSNDPHREKALKAMEAEKKTLAVEDRRLLDENDFTKDLASDPKVLTDLVRLGSMTTPGFNEGVRGRDDGTVFERDPAKNNLMVAIKMTEPHILQVRQLISDLDPGRTNKTKSDKPATKPENKDEQEEALAECVTFLKTMIGAYDKVIDMADRFKERKLTPLDAKLMQGYMTKKREYNAYIAKVERALAGKVKTRQAFERQTQDEEAAEKLESSTWIEDRIKLALGDADEDFQPSTSSIRWKMGDEGSTPPQPQPELSRKLLQARRERIDSAMTRELGQTDYGELDENLAVKPTQTKRRASFQDRQMRDPQFQQVWNSAAREKRKRRGVLDHAEVKNAWASDRTEREAKSYTPLSATG